MVWLLTAGCGLFGDKALPAGDPARPDVIFVSIDTLRADHVGSNGYHRDTTPFLDGLAAKGTRFAHARSPSPWTLPAHTTMLTGLLPQSHKVVDDTVSLDPATPVLPALARAQGYATGGFVATLYVSRKFGFERGFDRFEDFGIDSEKENLSGETTADEVVGEALSWLRDLPAGKPAFAFLHVYDVHYAYDPPAPYDTLFDRAPQKGDARYKNYFHFLKHPLDAAQMEHQVAQYDEAIRFVDAELARLDQALTAAGRKVRWVVTSDHGEEFGERGSWGHAHTLFAEQLRVPLIVSGADLPQGRVVEEPVGLEDLASTVAPWWGAAVAGDGLDLGPVLQGATPPERPFTAMTSRFKTNRVGLWEGHRRLEWDLADGTVELFDTAADPWEASNRAAVDPEAVTALKTRLTELLGTPWEAREAGAVQAKGGVFLPGEAQGTRAVAPGERFQLLPYDTALHFGTAPPVQAVGGERPGPDHPLVLHDVRGGGRRELDAQTREQLEALGYVQGD